MVLSIEDDTALSLQEQWQNRDEPGTTRHTLSTSFVLDWTYGVEYYLLIGYIHDWSYDSRFNDLPEIHGQGKGWRLFLWTHWLWPTGLQLISVVHWSRQDFAKIEDWFLFHLKMHGHEQEQDLYSSTCVESRSLSTHIVVSHEHAIQTIWYACRPQHGLMSLITVLYIINHYMQVLVFLQQRQCQEKSAKGIPLQH